MTRLLTVALLLVILVPAVHADQPWWSFEGLLPALFQMHEPLPASFYTTDGYVLSPEVIATSMDIRLGQPVVLIRDGAVVGKGTIGEIVAQKHPEALNRQMLYFRAAGLPDSLEVPTTPAGPSDLEDASYDLYVLTDMPVEVLAPDPAFTDITWGVHDYCVRVGRLRFAIIREYWPRTKQFRGWQVAKIEETGTVKVHADNTFQPRTR